jgi:hypothetical protein
MQIRKKIVLEGLKTQVKNLQDEKWQYLETKHFVRYIQPLDRDIKLEELDKQENNLARFSKTFNIKPKGKIIIITVKDRDHMKKLTKYELNGITFEDKIYSVYIYHPHEVIHFLANHYLGHPNILFMEGLAVLYGWDDGWQGKPIDHWMRLYNKNKELISVVDLFDNAKFNKFNALVSYPESAAFVEFLINEFGLKKFKRVYSNLGFYKSFEENKAIIEKELKINLLNLNKKFLIHLDKIK